MTKFDAGAAVERMEYDFTAFGGGSGFVQEPSTGKVNEFFRSVRGMMSEVQRIQKSLGEEEITLESDADEAELAAQMDKMDEASAASDKFQTGLIESIAILCGATKVYEDEDDPESEYRLEGGAPSYEDLKDLPFRVLQAFNTWLVQEIRPKAANGSQRPEPQDRRSKRGS